MNSHESERFWAKNRFQKHYILSFHSIVSLPVQVIPQLIARIDTPRALVGRLIHQLLTDIGRYHPQVSLLTLLLLLTLFPNRARNTFPVVTLSRAVSDCWIVFQALIYPLTVASKSTTTARHNAANKILKNMCEHCNTLVQQAIMVQRLNHFYLSVVNKIIFILYLEKFCS